MSLREAKWGRWSLTVCLLATLGCPNDQVGVSGGGGGDASSTGGSGTAGDATETNTMTGVAEGTGTGSTGASVDSTGADSTVGPPDTDTAGTVTDTAGTVTDTDGMSSGGSTGPGMTCGNDVAEGAEECDGTDLVGEDCISQGFDAGLLACAGDCTFDTSGCILMTCGNDLIEGAETCDGTDLDGEDCTTQGFDGGTLGCAGDCTAFDTSGCFNMTCGNDLIEGAEVCDGTDLAGEDCTTQGFDAGTLGCALDCSGFDTSGCFDFMCGNDLIEGVEVCDGTDLAGEDCASQGFDIGTLGCAMDCSGFDTSGCIDFAGDCCSANGTPGCDDLTCTADVCAADPFCCSVSWDGVCAGSAFTLCAGICDNCGDNTVNSPVEVCDGTDLAGEDCFTQGFDGGTLSCQADCAGFDTGSCISFTGDCCAANGTPGCDDGTCTAAVCAADPFCCSVTWDGTCAGEAFIEPACQDVGGSCPSCGDGVAEGAEACDGLDLLGEDCFTQGFDGGTLDCAVDCSSLDTAACISFSGDCCAANGSPGCDDAACTAAVCAGDPFCCSVSWDGTCAATATTEPACQDVGGSCPACGNDVIEGLEVCDGADLAGEDCLTLGFDGGTLGCAPDCSGLDTSICQFIGFGDCITLGPAACLPTEQCVMNPFMPSEGVCTDVECMSVAECPLSPPGGTAVVQCTDITGEGINECILSCAGGLLCPPGMNCAFGVACVWPP